MELLTEKDYLKDFPQYVYKIVKYTTTPYLGCYAYIVKERNKNDFTWKKQGRPPEDYEILDKYWLER